MILKAFSIYLQQHKDDIVKNKTSATKLLCEWIQLVLKKAPKSHEEKIVHAEIMLATNKSGNFFIIGKSDSGRVLVNALYNYALSYEHYVIVKEL